MTSVGESRSDEAGPVAAGSRPDEVGPSAPGPQVPAGESAPAWPAGGYSGPWPPADASAQGAYLVPPYQLPEPDRLTRLVNRIQARSPRWAAPVAALACMAGAVGYTLFADPAHSAPDAAPSCILKLTTGLDCPGCGGTRAFWYLLHGDLPAAARHHLMFVFAVPFLLYIYLAWTGRQVFGWRLPQLEITPKMIGIFLAAWAVFTVLRNLPWAPFDYLYV
ncbi:DUF2752 domain-containing protein [Plantactinospora sp. S1510]|uniref:DUF2752 domain-containing protein n=1 Tax=Plantactinospora alkalitolerans TaxID=2789879 RepID=A0ABS0HA23_9ACTN|nr:DUF2752 domain-containing protein [Plantactinospora alkalitolerans]MBF9135106.1 DUF2752 domain-containing protein [Plantactinospora alkalitolerans]